MKKNNPAPTSTSKNFKQYHYACKYSPDDTKFYHISSFVPSLQSSTPHDYLYTQEIISDLPKYRIKSYLECSVTRDEDGSYLIECPSLNLYSSGDSRQEAVENIKENIESLYEDLMENDDFSGDWLEIKKTLSKIIVHSK